MSMPIRTQVFVVEVSASIMPPLTEDEVHNAVARVAHEKERQRGMGYIDVQVREGFDIDDLEDPS